MIRIAPDAAEIQMVQARQAQQQAAAQGIASQWSAAQQGMPAAPLGGFTAPSPNVMGGGLGGMIGGGLSAAAALPSVSSAQSAAVDEEEQDEGFDWGGAGMGAVKYGSSGAAIGTKIMPGYGTAIGAGIGIIAGGLAGGYGSG
jgi:hypothetical protein